MFVETSGRRWSSDRMTTRPFGSVYFSYLIFGIAMEEVAVAVAAAFFAGAFAGADFFAASWQKADPAASAMKSPSVTKRLPEAEIIPTLLVHRSIQLQTYRSGAPAVIVLQRAPHDRCLLPYLN